jgi:predicted MPP superfamily phosphohydrolase
VACDALFVEPRRLVVERLDLPLSGLDRPLHGFKIAFLSDFHTERFSEHDEEALSIAASLDPDVLCLGGDLVQGKDAAKAADEMLSRCRASLGCAAVPGNWERWSRTGDEILPLSCARHGVEWLRNRHVVVRKGGAHLVLAGVDDPFVGAPDLDAALSGAPPGALRVLLCHAPGFAPNVPPGAVSLMLAGHTHGGQVRLPLLGALWTPGCSGPFEQGLYHVAGTPLYVSRGVGMSLVPVRFLCSPEVTLVTLRTA